MHHSINSSMCVVNNFIYALKYYLKNRKSWKNFNFHHYPMEGKRMFSMGKWSILSISKYFSYKYRNHFQNSYYQIVERRILILIAQQITTFNVRITLQNTRFLTEAKTEKWRIWHGSVLFSFISKEMVIWILCMS